MGGRSRRRRRCVALRVSRAWLAWWTSPWCSDGACAGSHGWWAGMPHRVMLQRCASAPGGGGVLHASQPHELVERGGFHRDPSFTLGVSW